MCTLASVWCLLFNYTTISGDGIRTREEQWEFLSEIACRDIEGYYQPMIGKASYNTREHKLMTIVVHEAACYQPGKLR